MTDAEIIKALKCCLDCNCKECPCYKIVGTEKRCTEIDEEEILDLINRQKAEIERLKRLHYNKLDTIHNLKIDIENLKKEMTEGGERK